MSYSEFKTIAEVRDRFELRVDESKNLFADIPPVEVREFMQQILERNIPLANAINTEKACSELLIAPTYWKSCIYLISGLTHGNYRRVRSNAIRPYI